MSPKVSVIMPVYNDEKYVRNAIKSVLNQTYNNIELIVINDGSTDNSDKIIESFLNDNRVIYYKFTTNRGVNIARNKGLSLVTGKYVSFLDSDDVWLRNKVYCQLKFMISDDINFSYCFYDLIKENGKFLKIVNELPSCTTKYNIIYTNSIPILTVMIRSDLMKNMLFPNIHHEDYALWLKLFYKKSLKAYLLPRIVAEYRVHRNSLSNNKFKSCIWVWNIYRNFMNFNLMKSFYCIFKYILNGIMKHQHIFGK